MKFTTVAKFVKIAAATVVASGTKTIVAGIIENNVKIGRPKDKIAVTAATWVISGIVATAAKKYTDETVDETMGTITDGLNWLKGLKVDKSLSRINKGESTFEAEGLDQDDFVKDEDDKWKLKPGHPLVEVSIDDDLSEVTDNAPLTTKPGIDEV